MTTASVEWICTTKGCHRPKFAQVVRPLVERRIPRLNHETWIRFRFPLDPLPPAPPAVSLTPIDASLIELLRNHPEREENQFRSAFRFWHAGFGDGYLWMEGDNPLCMVWLMTAAHQSAVARLGIWSGIYPPFAQHVGVAEGIYTFRRGLRRRGGAATEMAHALFHHMRQRGLTEARTQIHTDNLPALRWAERIGWQPMGTIHRCAFDLPLLRDRYLYLHDLAVSPANTAWPTEGERASAR